MGVLSAVLSPGERESPQMMLINFLRTLVLSSLEFFPGEPSLSGPGLMTPPSFFIPVQPRIRGQALLRLPIGFLQVHILFFNSPVKGGAPGQLRSDFYTDRRRSDSSAAAPKSRELGCWFPKLLLRFMRRLLAFLLS